MAPPDTTPARDLLASTKLSELFKPQHITAIKENASVDQCLRVLAGHRILSAPVVATESNDVQHKETAEPHDSIKDVAGFIDIRDVLSSFLRGKGHPSGSAIHGHCLSIITDVGRLLLNLCTEVDLALLKDAKMLKRMRVLEEHGGKFAGKSIKDLKSLGSDGWFYNLNVAQHASLREIIHDGFLYPKETKALFGGTRSRQVVHRLAMFDSNGQITNVVSQSDMIRFLFNHLEDLGALADTTVTDLGFVSGTSGVVTVRPETPALDAMVLMEERGISAVAVTNTAGAIIGNFSVSELRTIMAEHFGSLALPVGEFLALEHGTEYAGYAIQRDGSSSPSAATAGSSPPPSSAGFEFVKHRDMRRRDSHPGAEVGQELITCSPDSSLAEVLDKLVHNRLHRVYICDENVAPVGVITLTDILRKLVHP